MRGEIPTMRECEKSNSDISGLSTFGPSLDRINNGGTRKKMQEQFKTDNINSEMYKLAQYNGGADNDLGNIFSQQQNDLISVTTPNNVNHQLDASSSYSCNMIPNRMVEKSQSDISAISQP